MRYCESVHTLTLYRDRAVADYTDFKIVCKERTFDVHRVVLGTASEYFDKMFGSSFKVSET